MLTSALLTLLLLATGVPASPASAAADVRADAASIAPTPATVFADTAARLVEAATPPAFDAGFIITDELFYDGGALDADEMRQLATQVVMLKGGRVTAFGGPESLPRLVPSL